MGIKVILIILVLILLVGCNPKQVWDDFKNLKFKEKLESVPTNTTLNNTDNNTTNITVSEPTKIIYDNLFTNVFIPSGNSMLIIDKNISYLIDVPKENPLIINYLNNFGIKELEFAVATIDKVEHNGGMQYIVVKTPPIKIYDNGIENGYRTNYISRLDKYNTYWNRTSSEYIPLFNDETIGDFQFFTPYSRGLSTIKEENSIVVFYGKKILYMSDCYGGCENKMPPITTEYLILANGGICPTNSFDFILSVGAKYVIGDEICQALKDEMDIIGIKHVSIKDSGTIQILLGDGKDEFRTEIYTRAI